MQPTVVLVRTRNPLNIGAVARAMQNFGARDLRLVAPYEESFREARSAVGADAVLGNAQVYTGISEAVADCRLVIGTTAGRRRDLKQPLVSLEQASPMTRAAMAQGRVALLLGSEKHGLTREDFDHCHVLLRIPTMTEQPSMNLGQAAAVCLWELARTQSTDPTAKLSPIDEQPRATSGGLERLAELVLNLLNAAHYNHPMTQATTESHLRQMLRRLHVTEADTHLLMGMVRKILWKLHSLDPANE